MNEQDSEVEVVCGCLTEGGNSTRRAREPLRWLHDHHFSLNFFGVLAVYINSHY